MKSKMERSRAGRPWRACSSAMGRSRRATRRAFTRAPRAVGCGRDDEFRARGLRLTWSILLLASNPSPVCRWLSLREAAEQLQCSRRSVVDFLEDGRLHGEKVGGVWHICPSCAQRLAELRERIIGLWRETWFGERPCGWKGELPVPPWIRVPSMSTARTAGGRERRGRPGRLDARLGGA